MSLETIKNYFLEVKKRDVKLPVRFEISSMNYVLESIQNNDKYDSAVAKINEKLKEKIYIIDNKEFEKELHKIKKAVGCLKSQFVNIAEELAYFNPDKNKLMPNFIFDADLNSITKPKALRFDYDTLKKSKYFVQISRALNEKPYLGLMAHDYLCVSEPFNEEKQLIELLHSAKIPGAYHDKVLGDFEKLIETRTGEFNILAEEKYNPIDSSLGSAVKFASVTGTVASCTFVGLIVGAAGTVLCLPDNLLFGGSESQKLIVRSPMVLTAVLGGAAGIPPGLRFGCYLKDKITGNPKILPTKKIIA